MARLIAEIGSNHNRDLDRALRLIDACADAGFDAAKLQVFRIDDLFAPEVLERRDDLRARRAWEFPIELLDPIADHCHARGLALGATPFGLWAVPPLAARVDFLKVASYELLWHDLIRACAATGLPLVVSTGMATLDEVDAAVEAARDGGARELTLLHCVSGYPTPPDQANLAAIRTLREHTGCPVGWSDHTGSAAVVRRAIERWSATDVELHVDLDGQGDEAGPHNWTPAGLSAIADAPEATGADGDGRKVPMPIEASEVAWRTDPADGLRPLRATRPPADREQARSVASMRSYADKRQELDKLLARLAAPAVGAGECSILDAGCGVGHLAALFRELNPRCRYHGADQHAFLIDEANALNADDALTTFEVCDVQDLPERHPDGFDVVVSWKVLTWIPDFSEMLPSLMALARRHLFIAALFYEGDIDFHTRVSTHAQERQGLLGSSHYNVYSLPRFEAAARALGARAIDVHPFEIGIDLPRGDADAMGTYTERLADGRRVQFSGALHMPWKVIRIDL